MYDRIKHNGIQNKEKWDEVTIVILWKTVINVCTCMLAVSSPDIMTWVIPDHAEQPLQFSWVSFNCRTKKTCRQERTLLNWKQGHVIKVNILKILKMCHNKTRRIYRCVSFNTHKRISIRMGSMVGTGGNLWKISDTNCCFRLLNGCWI